MDRKQLRQGLRPFETYCRQNGYPIKIKELTEAYPGVYDTSYFVDLQADWAMQKGCYDAIELLIRALWDSTPYDTRKYVHALRIITQAGPHCGSDVLNPELTLSPPCS